MTKKAHNNIASGLKGVAQTVAQTGAADMQYTELRGRIFWFRRRAPEPLKPGMQILLGNVEVTVGKNGYVRLSLATSDRREAAKKARKLAHFLDEASDQNRQSKVQRTSDQNAPIPALTPDEIQHVAEVMYVQLLAADEDTAKCSLAEYLNGEDEIREPDRFVWSSADLPPQSTAGQIELLKKLRSIISFFSFTTLGKTIEHITPELVPFADAFRRYITTLDKRKASEIVLTPPLPVYAPLWSWSDAFAYYLKQRSGLSESTIANYKTAWTSLENSAKCSPQKLTADNVVSWRDGLLNKLHPQTVKSRLTFVGAIWRESRANGKIDRGTLDPFQGLKVKLNENSGGSREQFSAAELKIIFAADPVRTARAVSLHAGYWLPLLALYHGARLEEITGLEVIDIKDSNVGLLLHIRENSLRPRLKHRKKSERVVPLHPMLLNLGFASYVTAAREAGVKALFPSFASGASFGEAFVAHVKKLINPVPGRLVGMHCLRHCWETARRTARLDTSASNYITGRALDAGSAGRYGGPAGLAELKEEISKIGYGMTHLIAPTITSAELKAQDSLRICRTKSGK